MDVRRLRLSLMLLAMIAAFLGIAGTAGAAVFDPNGFRLASTVLFVHENAGNATVLIERTDTSREAQIRYITVGLTAQAPYDYAPQKGMLDFQPGQAVGSFEIPIVDHGIDGLPKTIQVSLFGPSPIGLAAPSTAVLTIVNDDPLSAPSPASTGSAGSGAGGSGGTAGSGSASSSGSAGSAGSAAATNAASTPDPGAALTVANPLGLPGAVTGNPLAGARFYVSPTGEAADAASRYPALKAISEQPGTARFGSFSYPNASVSVARYLGKADVVEPGTIPMLTTYRIVDGHCGHWADPPADVAAYEKWIAQFAAGIGTYRAVLFLEQDALITTGCLSPHGVAVRMAELRFAIQTLTTYCPHLVVYLDAGAADALPAARAAALLRQAGVARVQGFFLDATHFDWTSREIRYGQQISRLTGGKHFVVSTGESGRGPLVPRDRVRHGNEVLCNPAGRGLGPRPTTSTGYRAVDAFAWLDNPGGSSGACVPGAPPAGVYWPAYALMLVRNADYRVR